MEPRSPRPIPPSPAALSPSRRYIFVPRASLFRFRRSPLALAVGFVLAPCSSLSTVAVDLRFAAVVAPVFLPTRRHLLRLRRVVADPVRPSVSPADRRSTVVIVIPNRAAVFLRSDRRFRRPRCPGVSRGPPLSLPSLLRSLGRCSAAPMVAGGDHRGAGAPPPVGRAGEAAFGRAPRLPGGPGRQPPAPAGAADAWDPRRRPPPAACTRSTVDRGADAWAPLPWTRLARPLPRLTQ
uniref:Zinc knuckle domain-like n=1 Tax=Oryza nivara TaxID=4536 RepID=A0A679BA92_ORYNI|nr:zinc knuckle domain-like [Oryza sativa f. spontanea]BBF89760.1 zinc knuckle domain-like [Oryza sativa f. spontanea]BBF89763.1 zinc knuckle domain-like [Oryza sativa f. spontanea]